MPKDNKSSSLSLIKELRKKLNSTSLTDSTFANIEHHIDTGSLMLNLIMGGDMFKGIPAGRVVTLAGEEMTGKTLLAQQFAVNAQNTKRYSVIYWIDSEGGFNKENFKKHGVDSDSIEHVPVKSVEDCAHKMALLYASFEEIQKEDPDFRALVILDSLGALKTRKVFKDNTEDDPKLDRGLRARLINDMIGTCLMPAVLTKCGFIVLNHIYDDPNAMYVSKIKPMPGGRGLKFASHVIVQCSKAFTKNEKAKEEFGNYYSGTTLKFFTIKNREVPPFLEAQIDIDYANGISKYSGLLDLALKYGFVEEGHGVYKFKSGNVKKDLIYSKESFKHWDGIVKELNEKAKAEMQYGGLFNKSNEVSEEEKGILNDE